MLTDVLLIIIAYLIGSISSAILVCRLAGLPDPRTEGSRNPGATNVLRIGGKGTAVVTLAGDFLKGLIAVLIARVANADALALAAVGFAAFLGHVYPVFFGFQGGKGVATAFGVLLGLSWMVSLATLVTWLAVAALFRISSLAALTAAVMVPVYVAGFTTSREFLVMSMLMSLLLIWRHRSNIRNLLQGTEKDIGTNCDGGGDQGTSG